uniref:GPI transamidase component PIG-T n=1 Tax=Ditylenchus dipsaci TaxID=166011 RepID=A0A915CLC4_9BILA
MWVKLEVLEVGCPLPSDNNIASRVDPFVGRQDKADVLIGSDVAVGKLDYKAVEGAGCLEPVQFTIQAESPASNEDSSLFVPWLLRTLFKEYSIEHFQLSLTQGFWRSNFGELNLLWKLLPALIFWSNLQETTVWMSDDESYPHFFPHFIPQPSSGNWRYGQLSQESVCSENLKSWKKFLPCKEKGLVSLLEPRQLLSSNFHSISIGAERQVSGNFIKWNLQFLAKTVHPTKKQDTEGLSVSGMFGREITSKCPVASFSNVHLHDKEKSNHVLSVHTFTKSLSQSGGTLSTRIENTQPKSLQVNFMQMVPWQLRLFLHTLQFSCLYQKHWLVQSIHKSHYSLAKDMQRPLLLELSVEVPADAVCRLEVDYQTAFLKITEYPADANSGVYVPGPVLTDLNGGVVVHGEPVLVLLPVPDFSMPFNVLCLVCTSIAIFYGNVLTTTTKLMKAEIKKERGGAKKLKLQIIKEKMIAFFGS